MRFCHGLGSSIKAINRVLWSHEALCILEMTFSNENGNSKNPRGLQAWAAYHTKTLLFLGHHF